MNHFFVEHSTVCDIYVTYMVTIQMTSKVQQFESNTLLHINHHICYISHFERLDVSDCTWRFVLGSIMVI